MDLDRLMTRNPKFCLATSPLEEVARAMRDEDVGEIPVVDLDRHPIGVITDRDIVVRCVAEGETLDACLVDTYMTAPAVSLPEDASVEDIANAMAKEAVRRIPITDKDGKLCGIVAQADLEHSAARSQKEKVSQRVSTPH